MTALTEESLTATLERLASMVLDAEQRMSLRPKHLIIPPAIYRRLMWRPPIKKARGIRGRKRAINKRTQPALWKMMRQT